MSMRGNGTGHRRMPAQCQPYPPEPRADRGHLRAYLGSARLIWLGKGVSMTRRRPIDNLACFVRPGVVLGWTDNKRDVQHAISLMPWERLQDARDAHGRRLKGP